MKLNSMKCKVIHLRDNAILETTGLSLEKDKEENLGKPGDHCMKMSNQCHRAARRKGNPRVY